MNEAPQSEKRVGALSSGLRILRYLARASEPVGVSRIAKDTNTNPSTCYNLLKTLVLERLITFDEPTKTYSLGLGLVELAKGSLEKASYARLLHPHLREIADRHNVTATLWQRTRNDRMVLVDLVESSSAIRINMSIGQRLPMYIAALGRCMAAYSNLSVLELRSKLSSLRWQDGPSFETYMQEVNNVREYGYAIDNGNFERGILTVSSPILNSQQEPLMAISAVGFSTQLDENSIIALCDDLRERCREATQTFSGGVIKNLWTSNDSVTNHFNTLSTP